MATVGSSKQNTKLSYSISGAKFGTEMRCPRLVESYSVVAEESHSRRLRAFYPHLRIQGTFAMTFDYIGWEEFNAAQWWFTDYIHAMLTERAPSPMLIRLDAREFLRYGIPTTGITYGDHTASMVFSPTITFVSVADLHDPRSAVVASTDASVYQAPSDDDKTPAEWFYPESSLNRPGNLKSYLYDEKQVEAGVRALKLQNEILSIVGLGF